MGPPITLRLRRFAILCNPNLNVSVSNEAYRRIVEAVPEGIWAVDPQGWTIFSNRRMAEILGVDFESMPRQSCFGCVFPDDLEEAQRHFARTLAGDSRPFDFRLRRADGSPMAKVYRLNVGVHTQSSALWSPLTRLDILIRFGDWNRSTSICPDNRNFKNDFSWNRHVWAKPSISR